MPSAPNSAAMILVKPMIAEFGIVVVNAPRQKLLSGHARDVENAAGGRLLQVRNRVLGGVDIGHQVGVQDRRPHLVGHAVERARDHAADIVDQDVEPAQGVHRAVR